MRLGAYGKSIAVLSSSLASVGLFSASLRAQNADDEVGRAAIEDHCKLCHAIETVTNERRSADEWKVVVGRMIKNGAQLTEGDQATIIAYLSKTYSSQVIPNPGDGKTGAAVKPMSVTMDNHQESPAMRQARSRPRRRNHNLSYLDPAFVAELSGRLPALTAECIQDTFGISANTWLKLRKGMPIRRSVAERLLDRFAEALRRN